MKTLAQIQADSKRHQQALAADPHCQCELEYMEQAKRELEGQANSGIDFIRQVLHRAQQIKLERGRNNGKK